MTSDYIVSLLQQGEVVAMPTETVYGLFADATNPHAIAKLSALKQRNPHQAYSVMLGDIAMISTYADISSLEQAVIDRFMPGALTLLLSYPKNISDSVLMGSERVGVRIPDCALLSEVLRMFGKPLVAPSANPTGLFPAQTPNQVRKYFGDDFPILDGSCGSIGIPSTVLRIQEDGRVKIMREGMLTGKIIDFVSKNSV